MVRCHIAGELATPKGRRKKSQDKIDAILKVKKPENVTQLRSFLGLVQYYGKFLQNLATEARPLNELLEKTRNWSLRTIRHHVG
jgi:hypothetical protein